MAVQFLETDQRPGIEAAMMQLTPEQVETAAVHLLVLGPEMSNATLVAAHNVAVNFFARMPSDELLETAYREGRTAFPRVSDIVSDEEKVLQVSVEQPGVIGEFVFEIAANNDTAQVLDALENSTVADPSEVPGHEVEEVVRTKDTILAKATEEAHDGNDEQLYQPTNTIFERSNELARKTPKQVADDIHRRTVAANIGDRKSIDKIRRVLPSAARELQNSEKRAGDRMFRVKKL